MSSSLINLPNLYSPYRENLLKIFSSPTLSGMKILLLDEECSSLIGVTYSFTKILHNDIYMVRPLSDNSPKIDKSLDYLKAVVFLRPTPESVQALCNQLRNPRHREYHIFFVNCSIDESSSNRPNSFLRQLAEIPNVGDYVKQVQSFYFDAHIVTPHVFSADREHTIGLYHATHYWKEQERETWQRSIQAVLTSMALLRLNPDVRYHRASSVAKLFSEDLVSEMTRLRRLNSSLFARNQTTNTKNSATVIILDRLTDPVTPILQCWLYQSMIHEQLGIKHNRVDLSKIPNYKEEVKEVTLTCAPQTTIRDELNTQNLEYDMFFSKNYCKNFGEIGILAKEEVTKHSEAIGNAQKINSIQDMQSFVDKFPAIRAKDNEVSKHITILSELARLNTKNSLMDCSEVEQKLACDDNHKEAYADVDRILHTDQIPFENKLNILMLFALRYETRTDEIKYFKDVLQSIAPSQNSANRAKAVDSLLHFAGSLKRGNVDLFNNRSVWSKVGNLLSGSTLGGVVNVFTRHKPLLSSHLESLSNGKLLIQDFPSASQTETSVKANATVPVPNTVIFFIVGGMTYEESAAINTFLEGSNGKMNVLIGGTSVINSTMFKNALLKDTISNPNTVEDTSINLSLNMFD